MARTIAWFAGGKRAAEWALGGLGQATLDALSDLGGLTIFGFEILAQAFRPPYRVRNFLAACEAIGTGSIAVVVITAAFTGGVFSMQTTIAFELFNSESLVGAAVALSLTRELAPALTGLMVTGRAGSAIATELGSMRVTEQIDALATMAVNPFHYLLVPRVLAALVTVPLLTMIFDVVGLFGAYLVAVGLQDIGPAEFWSRVHLWVDLADVFGGLIKAAAFGLTIAVSCCYKGFTATGGAKGVGIATTKAVVTSSVLIFVLDYALTSLMLGWWQDA
ncbi:MAG TPA: ABC transporter permease [Vulgatibacter sp.]|nr:ABC transporter permease [Vulgatibacter sp.]